MSKKLTEFDKRMQNYKYTSDQSLMRRTPVIIQIDGMHFHTFTKGLDKPFDEILVQSMLHIRHSHMKNLIKALCL